MGRGKGLNIRRLVRARGLAGGRQLQAHLHRGRLAPSTHPITKADSLTHIEQSSNHKTLEQGQQPIRLTDLVRDHTFNRPHHTSLSFGTEREQHECIHIKYNYHNPLIVMIFEKL